MMVNLLTGGLALAGLTVFLLEYATVLDRAPLWIIVVGTLLLPLYDWLNSLRGRD